MRDIGVLQNHISATLFVFNIIESLYFIQPALGLSAVSQMTLKSPIFTMKPLSGCQ